MKKRGPGGNAKSSAAVGAGDAGVVEVVDDTEGQGMGDNEDSTNNSKKAKITSVRELGETSKPPTKITKKSKIRMTLQGSSLISFKMRTKPKKMMK